ncbi:MAG: hypothetical protein ACRC1M_05545 [Methanobacteriaceae archaeon]
MKKSNIDYENDEEKAIVSQFDYNVRTFYFGIRHILNDINPNLKRSYSNTDKKSIFFTNPENDIRVAACGFQKRTLIVAIYRKEGDEKLISSIVEEPSGEYRSSWDKKGYTPYLIPLRTKNNYDFNEIESLIRESYNILE